MYKSPLDEGLSLFGKNGSLYLKDERSIWMVKSHQKELELVRVEGKNLSSMWNHFAECINSEAIPLTSGLEARKSLELVLAIYRSTEIGKPVRLPLK